RSESDIKTFGTCNNYTENDKIKKREKWLRDKSPDTIDDRRNISSILPN
ncbi:1499_t:CDS:1, partial [Dentiscutata heterogama]